jgi:hypothetical protein
MTTLAIDAKEQRYVVMADVKVAYLVHANMDELVLMVFEGNMVDYVVQTNLTKYAKYVRTYKQVKKESVIPTAYQGAIWMYPKCDALGNCSPQH